MSEHDDNEINQTSTEESGSGAGDFDFIKTYVQYADVLEVPPEAHESVALLMLTAVMNGKVYFLSGIKKISLDLWLLLLSESSMGRNYLVDDIARPVLERAGLAGLIHNATWGSAQAFYQQIANQPVGLYIWPELSIILKKFQDPRFAGVQEWLTDLKDGNTTPASITYRATGRRSNTPPIIFGQAPRINILSSSSTSWFYSNLTQEDSTGGFIPRWTIRLLPKSDRTVPFPASTDASLLDALAEHLKAVIALSGEAAFTDCRELYDKWYRETKRRFEDRPNPVLAGPFFRRLRTQVLQFAIAYHVSEKIDLKIGRRAMERAIQMAREIEESIFKILPTGMTHEGAEVERMADLIRGGGAAGVNRTVLTLAFKHWKSRDRKERLETLREARTVETFRRVTKGRPAQVYVHEEHLAEHARRFPNEKRPDD